MLRLAAVLLATLTLAAGLVVAQEAPPAPPATPAATPPAPASDAAATTVVPVHHEPHHRQVFQYGPMRILDLQIPPNDMSWFHSHEWPVLYMTLGTSQTRTQNLGQEWGGRGGGRTGGARPGGAAPRAGGPGGGAPRAGGPPAAGGRGAGPASPRATSTTGYIEQPVTHRLENIGTGLFRAMVVVNETHGDDTTSQEQAGFQGTPELTNRWFRAYRITLKPGESTPAHRHRAPAVLFQATAGKGVAAAAMKWEFNEPGQWAFFDTGDQHEVRNAGDTPLELIEVEVRRK